MLPLGLMAGRVARAIGLGRSRIERITAEQLGISGESAIRLGRLFRTSAQFWMNLQQSYELEKAALAMGEAADRIQPIDIAA